MGERFALVRASVAAAAALAAFAWCAAPAPAYATGPPCGQKLFNSPNGVGFRILFANNGTVQEYDVTTGADNTELVNDARTSLENTYGPAGWNAPALKIISFKKGDAPGLMVPDKAIDSCGRTISFN